MTRLPEGARFRDDEPRLFEADAQGSDRVLFAVMLVTDRGGPETARLDSAWTSQPDAELRCEELWRLFGVWRVPLSAIVAKIEPPVELAVRWPA